MLLSLIAWFVSVVNWIVQEVLTWVPFWSTHQASDYFLNLSPFHRIFNKTQGVFKMDSLTRPAIISDVPRPQTLTGLDIRADSKFQKRWLNPQTPKVFRQPKTPKGGGVDATPPGFLPSRPNFLKIFLMGMFSGSRNPTVIMKKFYLHCMTLKIKVNHLFAWPFLSPVVNMIQSWSWCRF